MGHDQVTEQQNGSQAEYSVEFGKMRAKKVKALCSACGLGCRTYLTSDTDYRINQNRTPNEMNLSKHCDLTFVPNTIYCP